MKPAGDLMSLPATFFHKERRSVQCFSRITVSIVACGDDGAKLKFESFIWILFCSLMLEQSLCDSIHSSNPRPSLTGESTAWNICLMWSMSDS